MLTYAVLCKMQNPGSPNGSLMGDVLVVHLRPSQASYRYVVSIGTALYTIDLYGMSSYLPPVSLLDLCQSAVIRHPWFHLPQHPVRLSLPIPASTLHGLPGKETMAGDQHKDTLWVNSVLLYVWPEVFNVSLMYGKCSSGMCLMNNECSSGICLMYEPLYDKVEFPYIAWNGVHPLWIRPDWKHHVI